MATERRGEERESGPSKRISSTLVALSSAAVLTVYTAGYVRTRSAAERFEAAAAPRRMAVPAPVSAPAPEVVPAAPVTPGPSSTSTAPNPTPAPAEAPAEPAASATVADRGQYKDGTYLGWGSCRHGDIQASVVVVGGRIVSATIAQCLTLYPCSDIDDLLPIVVNRQMATLDWVSGATDSSDAFFGAIDDALFKAK